MKYTTKAWVARDKDGAVFMFKNRPEKGEEHWESDDMQFQHITWWNDEFGELSWEEGARPIEISMPLKCEKIVKKIEVGKYLSDIFFLECVKSVDKDFSGKIKALVREYNGIYGWAHEGDFICEREDGLWMIVKKGDDQ